jgi:hypothetical protein
LTKGGFLHKVKYMKTLSVKQPYATLICAGVKAVENRTWKTNYRGKMLIHASGDNWSFFSTEHLPQSWLNKWNEYLDIDEWNCASDAPESVKAMYDLGKRIWRFYGIAQNDPRPINAWMKQAVKERGFFFNSMSIIGECTLTDIIQDSYSDFAESGCFHWLLSKPVLYDKPIPNVVGHLRLWNYNP